MGRGARGGADGLAGAARPAQMALAALLVGCVTGSMHPQPFLASAAAMTPTRAGGVQSVSTPPTLEARGARTTLSRRIEAADAASGLPCLAAQLKPATDPLS